MNLVIIAGSYPSALDCYSGAFVRQFVLALARQGHCCTIINPVRWLARRFGPLPPRQELDCEGEVELQTVRPRMLSFSMKHFGPIRAGLLTQAAFNQAVRRTVSKLRLQTDLFYGHFLYPAGYAALVVALEHGRPGFTAVGEGTLWTVKPVGVTRARKQLQAMTGFLAVSSLVAGNLRNSLQIPSHKIGVFPNGVDLRLFSPRDPKVARRQFGLPEGPLYISFAGRFDELKGVARLVEAVRGLADVKLILAGQGKLPFDRTPVAFEGAIKHHCMPDFLAASDLFVLPTCEEGSCNAVIEAMACGLPIITSNGPYMDDLVNDSTAIRVDPIDVPALRQAVVSLVRDPQRRRALAAASLAHSRAFDINQRANRVVGWLREKAHRTYSAVEARDEAYD